MFLSSRVCCTVICTVQSYNNGIEFSNCISAEIFEHLALPVFFWFNFASTAVAVNSMHALVFRLMEQLPSDLVNEHMSTIWSMVWFMPLPAISNGRHYVLQLSMCQSVRNEVC